MNTQPGKNEDEKMVKALQRGDIFAFNELFHKYSQKIYNFIIKHIRREDDVEDLMQEIFICIWNRRKSIDEKQSFNGYLFAITLNAIRKYFRRKNTDDKAVYRWLEEIEPYSNITALTLEYNELEKIAEEMIEKLPPRRRMVFLLSRKEGLTNDEIASILKIKKKTVENHLNLALSYLREKLRKQSFLIILFFVFFY